MFHRLFSNCFRLTQQHPQKFLFVLVGLIILSIAGLFFVSFDNDVAKMLPADDAIAKGLHLLRTSDFTGKVVVSFELIDEQYSVQDLIYAVDRFAGSLGPPLVSDVFVGPVDADMSAEMRSFMAYAPQITNQSDLMAIDARLNPEGVDRALSSHFRQLLSPMGSFVSQIVRLDPLGVKTGTAVKLQNLLTPAGYDVRLENGHVISQDGKNAMAVITTPISVTDGFGSRRLVSYLEEKRASLPPYVSSDIIAGHLHTLSNENVIKKDISRVLLAAGVGIIGLFLFVFRSVKAVIIFFLPLVSVLLAIQVTHFIYSPVSYFIMGMGGVIAGIAVDYGIHIYVAVKKNGSGSECVSQVAKPVTIGALTTISIFASFFFSHVEGYHQLALFSIISILICLLLSLFFLPHWLNIPTKESSDAQLVVPTESHPGKFDRTIVVGWVIASLLLLFLSSRASLDFDIKAFDGTEASVLESEEKFQKTWGQGEMPGIFVVSGPTLEATKKMNESVYQDIAGKIDDETFFSVARIFPSDETRTENIRQWNQFWHDGREEKLRRLLNQIGPRYRFSKEAFDPFFDSLYMSPDIDASSGSGLFFEKLKERYIFKDGTDYQILSLFPDEQTYLSVLDDLTQKYPGSYIVSSKNIARLLSISVQQEIIYLALIAAVLIPLLTGLLLRDLRLSLIALVPVIFGILALLGLLPLFGVKMNAPAIIASMVVVGLSVDYGIFMAYSSKYVLRVGTRLAVFLSAFTTIIGAGALLFADHPVFFTIGATLVTGVLGGYIASILVVPALFRTFYLKQTETV